MIRFKQRMSLCSEVSGGSSSDGSVDNDYPSPLSIAFERQAQKDSRRHSPPILPPVPVVMAPPISQIDPPNALGLPPPSSSDSSLASFADIPIDSNRAATTIASLPMSHVEIPPIESKIHTAKSSDSSAPPAAIMMTDTTSTGITVVNNQGSGTKRKVSDATDGKIHGEDSSSSHTHVVDSDNSPIIASSKKGKRPRTKDSADSPLHVVPPPQPRLLACPSDHLHLPPVHCFVRRQIEVFAATSEDVAAPRPGRKVRIQQGQVGLRCIHCRRAEADAINDATSSTSSNTINIQQRRPKRIKRAVCYPSQISRIYSSVSDMKFDHFGICPHMPVELREELTTLKASHGGGGSSNVASSSASSVASTSSTASSASSTSTGRSTSSSSSSAASTARYYRETARLVLGLVDVPTSEGGAVGGGGIRFGTSSSSLAASSGGVVIQPSQTPPLPTTVDIAVAPKKPKRSRTTAAAATTTEAVAKTLSQAQGTFPQQVVLPLPLPSPIDDNTTTTNNDNKTFLLAAPEDEQILNPIHCFVRRNVEVFAATSEDIAARRPVARIASSSARWASVVCTASTCRSEIGSSDRFVIRPAYPASTTPFPT